MTPTEGSKTAEPMSPRAAVAAVPAAVLDSRRRPGRAEQVNPHLIPLLRSPATMEIPAPLSIAEEAGLVSDDLSAARGIGIGLVLAVPAWAAIGWVTWALLR